MAKLWCQLFGHVRTPHKSVARATPYLAGGLNYCWRCNRVHRDQS